MRKKPGPAPTGKGTLIGVRLQPELLSALDRFCEESGNAISRPEGLRVAFKDWAVGQGYLDADLDMTGD
jgi:hypothetical protein